MLPPSCGFAASAFPVVLPPPPLELLLLPPPPHAAAAISTSASTKAVIRGLVRDAAGFSTFPPGCGRQLSSPPSRHALHRFCDGRHRSRRERHSSRDIRSLCCKS